MNDVIGVAEVEVRARLDRLDAGLKDARQKTETATRNMEAGFGRIGDASGPLGRNMTKLETAFTRVEQRAVSFRAAATRMAGGVGIAAAAITAAVKPALDFADRLDKMAISTGVSVERLQSLRFAADQTGAGADFVSQGLERLNRRLGEFVNTGAGPAKDALEQLGIAQDIATGQIEAGEPALDAILARLDGVEGNAEKAAVAAKLFGDEAGPRMVRMLSQGKDGVAALEQQFIDMGVTVDQDTIKKLVAVRDELTAFGAYVKGQFIYALVAAVEKLVEFGQYLGWIDRQLGLVGDAKLTSLKEELADNAAEARKLRDENRAGNGRHTPRTVIHDAGQCD